MKNLVLAYKGYLLCQDQSYQSIINKFSGEVFWIPDMGGYCCHHECCSYISIYFLVKS